MRQDRIKVRIRDDGPEFVSDVAHMTIDASIIGAIRIDTDRV